MRRLTLRLITTIVCLTMLLAAATVYAQDDETTDPAPPPPAEIESAIERVNSAVERAEIILEEMETIQEQANSAVDLANSMFTFFEVMSAVVGIVVPVLIVIGGLLGFRRLEQANVELRQAREQFESEMNERSKQLETVRLEMEATTREQRESASAASIALALMPVGDRQYRAQDYSGALDSYSRALQFDERNPIIHYRMGYVYTQSGELDNAKASLQRALELDPQFVPAQAALGYVYRRMGDGIQKEIDRLVKGGADLNAPDVMKLSVDRDRTYIRSEENFVEAMAALPKLMDEDGESWWGALGGLYRRRGQTQQAIMAYERGTQVTPQSSYPFSNLALLYAEVGDYEKMQKTYKRVEQLAYGETQADVDNYWAYADLIVARLAQGKIKETLDVLDTTLETAPADSPYTLESLMDTLSRLASYLPEDKRPSIEDVIARIQTFIDNRAKRKEESEQLVADLTAAADGKIDDPED